MFAQTSSHMRPTLLFDNRYSKGCHAPCIAVRLR
ncbi:hypothetical protein FOQG_18970 [Fusarium oxysporum f. sp. raphani 54005]|uniref:Uncharacterized protein n=2 Tax=Fusarium oxysporum species complex TaxID=171631 RepID=X0C0G2_FUSOX|nr:hypothetical protein FOQG_18970 [Fusarium oxysporum f. sp. raphani 54005]